MTDLAWSSDRIEKLKKLASQGLSAAQIAAELSGGFSRSAIIGKIRRLGIRKAPCRVERAAKEKKPARILRGAAGEQRRQVRAEAALEFDAGKPIVKTDTEISAAQRVGLEELTSTNCHWPVGDPRAPDFFFCGGKAVEGLPYCMRHCRVAFPNVGERRRSSV